METDPNGSPLVKIVFDTKSRMFGVFNFKMPLVGIFDGISGTYSFSNPQTGGISTLDERIKMAKYIHNNKDIMKLFSNGVDNIDYSCVFSTYRKVMTKALAFVEKNLLQLQEHVYPYENLTLAFYGNPSFNMTKYFMGKESFLSELRLSFTKAINNLRSIIANGDITADMETVGAVSTLFNKQTSLSKAIIKFLIAVYTKQNGKFDTHLLKRLSDVVTLNSTKKEMLIDDIIRKI